MLGGRWAAETGFPQQELGDRRCRLTFRDIVCPSSLLSPLAPRLHDQLNPTFSHCSLVALAVDNIVPFLIKPGEETG